MSESDVLETLERMGVSYSGPLHPTGLMDEWQIHVSLGTSSNLIMTIDYVITGGSTFNYAPMLFVIVLDEQRIVESFE